MCHDVIAICNWSQKFNPQKKENIYIEIEREETKLSLLLLLHDTGERKYTLKQY